MNQPPSPVPAVSVLMCVYNGAAFLREAVDSILGQTFRDFEFLIVDDGSTDGTKAILDSYRDPRLVRITNERNLGLTASLNHGLAAARGRYLARMDADDISLPDRLARQVAFLEAHPAIGIAGTQFEVIGDARFIAAGETRLPDSPGLVRWLMYFRSSLAHPTIMAQRALLQELGGYDPAIHHCEDYDLWLRALRCTAVTNLPEVLFRLRKHAACKSVTTLAAGHQSARESAQRALQVLLDRPVSIGVLLVLRREDRPASGAQLAEAAAALAGLLDHCLAQATPAEARAIRVDAAARFLALSDQVAIKQRPGLYLGLLGRAWQARPASLAACVAAGFRRVFASIAMKPPARQPSP